MVAHDSTQEAGTISRIAHGFNVGCITQLFSGQPRTYALIPATRI